MLTFLPIMLVVVINQSIFWRSFIVSICCNYSSSKSIGAILSPDSNTSVGVDFMALKMSINTLFSTASKSLQCLSVYFVCPKMMLSYSSLEQINHLKIWIARSTCISGKG